VRSAAAEGVRTPAVVLPHLDRIQASFGHHPIGQIKAHVGAGAAQAARAMNARAFASGVHVVFGGTPDLRTAAHEAAHVLQQRAGVDLPSGVGAPGDRYERHADAVADRVVHGQSAEPLLPSLASSPGAAAPRPTSGAPAVQMERSEERMERRRRMFKPTLDPEEIRRRKEESRKARSKARREKTLWQSRERPRPEEEPTTAQEMEGVTSTTSALTTPFVFEFTDEFIHRQVDLEIQDAIEASKDTIELDAALKVIQIKHGLKSIEMVDLGTPEAAVQYQINPWYKRDLPSGKVIFQMLGTESKPITKVHWESENLTIGAQTAKVGKHMIANPLAPDYEPGSKSTNDTDQDKLMSELANAGKTSVPNDQKYIKGHLLNDHVGGPGLSYNLFPITADANAKHLAYVEKFVKAQLKSNFVIYYKVFVEDKAPVDLNNDGKKPFKVDSEVKFHWYLLDTSGKQIKSAHTDKIESTYNAKGAAPFDVTTEYASEYDKLNTGKGTPKALMQTGQWQKSSITSPGMQGMKMPTTLGTFSFPSGHLGSSSTTAAIDFTDVKPKKDVSNGLDFISVRNKHAPDATAIGKTMLVGSPAVSVTITSIHPPLAGGWTRIYFK